MANRIYLFAALLFVVLPINVQAMFLLRPYEQMVEPEFQKDFCWQFSILPEVGFDTVAFNENGACVNPLQIWNPTQDALKMLEGFDPLSAIGQLRTKIGANDDGVRGHFIVNGDFKYHGGVGFSARKGFPYNLCLGVHMPVYSLALQNVQWINETQNISADDARVRQYLTNDFFTNVFVLGDGLSLQGWKRAGIGDLTLMGEWIQEFEQEKEFLHNVRLQARLGLGFPTGKKADEDKIFALPFGFDGAYSLILGAGLTAEMACYLRAGVYVELTHLFSTTQCRRIKTNINQTELLLLQKFPVLKNYGLLQEFNLYAEFHHFFDGFSAKAGYQFFRRGDDNLVIIGNEFSSNISNTSLQLEEWTLHQLFLIGSYDLLPEDDCRFVHPYVSLFVKLPFNGQFRAQQKTVGAVLSVDF